MSNTTTITPDMLTKLYERMSRIETLLSVLLEKWWDAMHQNAIKDFVTGDYITLSSKEDIENFFNFHKNRA